MTEESFTPEMEDKSSSAFKRVSLLILNVISNALQNTTGYLGSEVIRLRPGSVIADVSNMYDTTSTITKDEVDNKVDNAVESCNQLSECLSWTSENTTLCDVNPCLDTFSTCTEDEGFATCTCLPGFVKSEFGDICTVCANGFMEKEGICVKCEGQATGINCMDCPDGYTNENGVCKKCSFGYSGKKCQEPFLLVVVVVSTIAGAALIALITAVIVLSVRKHSTKGDDLTNASNFRISYRAHSKSLRSQVGDEKSLTKGNNPYEDIEPVTYTNPAYKNDKSSSEVYY